MKSSLLKLTLFLQITTLLAAFVFAQDVSKLKQSNNNWFCDDRLELNLVVGTVVEISPFKKNADNKTLSKFTQNGNKYKTINIVRFKIADIYSDEESSIVQDFFNTSLENIGTFEFKLGEKYVFDGNIFRPDTSKKSSTEYKFIKPDSFIKSFSDAKSDIDFLKAVKNLNIYTDIFGADAKDVLIAPKVSSRMLNLVKPIFSDEVRKLNATENIKVMVLVDENGKIIRAKSICVKNELLAPISEKAALSSTFSPTIIAGKRVRIIGFLTYRFTAK
jgi:hypothetical protein